MIYVGDQPADWRAAQAAGANFLGVSYGWGISKEDTEFPVVNSPKGITEYLLSTSAIFEDEADYGKKFEKKDSE